MATAAADPVPELRVKGLIRRCSRLVGVVCSDSRGGGLLVELGPAASGLRHGDTVALVEGGTMLLHNGRLLPVVDVAAWGRE